MNRTNVHTRFHYQITVVRLSLILMIFVLTMTYLWLQAINITLNYRNQKWISQHNQLVKDNKYLQVKISSKTDLRRIETIAITKLDMVFPMQVRYLYAQ